MDGNGYIIPHYGDRCRRSYERSTRYTTSCIANVIEIKVHCAPYRKYNIQTHLNFNVRSPNEVCELFHCYTTSPFYFLLPGDAYTHSYVDISDCRSVTQARMCSYLTRKWSTIHKKSYLIFFLFPPSSVPAAVAIPSFTLDEYVICLGREVERESADVGKRSAGFSNDTDGRAPS